MESTADSLTDFFVETGFYSKIQPDEETLSEESIAGEYSPCFYTPFEEASCLFPDPRRYSPPPPAPTSPVRHTSPSGPVDQPASENPSPPEVHQPPVSKSVLSLDQPDGVLNSVFDGILNSVFLDTVKAGIATLLSVVISEQTLEDCYGCQTLHPSQKHHPCLYPLPLHYFYLNFKKLMERLLTWRFLPGLLTLLESQGVVTSAPRLMGACEAFLYEFKNCADILEKIKEITAELVGDNEAKADSMNKLVTFWKESRKAPVLVHTYF